MRWQRASALLGEPAPSSHRLLDLSEATEREVTSIQPLSRDCAIRDGLVVPREFSAQDLLQSRHRIESAQIADDPVRIAVGRQSGEESQVGVVELPAHRRIRIGCDLERQAADQVDSPGNGLRRGGGW
ncbi:hypothetical protein GCM10022380_05300 [Amycolatopsis tucumanensis]|uniref:Uncharacterized protein n=1 Tax=Amycolatopsis tucumanensis TaxID=401106 RepID=A0ABP7HG39_9PSEU